jgi:transposase
MLNIFPSSLPTVPRHPPTLRRRRGGQPSNRNALIHGLYALKNSTPLNKISSTLPALPRVVDASSLAVSQQIIQNLMQDICLVYQQMLKAQNNPAMDACCNTLVSMVGLVGRLKVDFARRFLLGSDLHVVSQDPLHLIHDTFWKKGLVSEAHSFGSNICKNDFNSLALEEALCPSVSRARFPFLPPRQWAVLEPLLPRVNNAGKRGRPFADPRILLDAVFWKLAHHAHWQDLPRGYPSMHTCRRYYRRLFLSGCLDLLYTALYDDLLTRGRTGLPSLVRKGSAAVYENKVILRRGLDKSWQTRTALLFLQQGYQALRRKRRETARGERLRRPTARMIARNKEIRARASMEENLFAFTPIDLAHLGSDRETGDELAVSLGKRPHKPPRHIDNGSYSFIPIDLGNLGSDENEGGPLSLEPVSPAPSLVVQDTHSPPGSYSPTVPKTQSHSGELTPKRVLGLL